MVALFMFGMSSPLITGNRRAVTAAWDPYVNTDLSRS